MEEIWKDIEEYEGLYQISNLGRVRSLNHFRENRQGGYEQKGRIRKIYNSKTYSYIRLSKNGKTKTYTIHKLVANVFLEKVKGKKYINHIDGNKHNNKINNLEWCTSSENQKHALTTGLRNKNARAIKIMQCTIEGKTIKIWESLMEASRKTGIKEGAISNCINQKGKTAGGYKWIIMPEE